MNWDWLRKQLPRRRYGVPSPEPAPTPMAPLDGDTSASYMRRLHLAVTVLRADHARLQAGLGVDPATVCAALVEVGQLAMTARARTLDEQAALASIPDYPPEEH